MALAGTRPQSAAAPLDHPFVGGEKSELLPETFGVRFQRFHREDQTTGWEIAEIAGVECESCDEAITIMLTTIAQPFLSQLEFDDRVHGLQ